MIRKRIEETDAQGRTVTTTIEEPDDAAIVETQDDAVVETYDETTVSPDPGSGTAVMISKLSWWVGLAGLTVFTLLALRLSFETSHANSTGFVDFIYRITGPLVQPFEGIANARTLDGGGVFHPETAIAMGIYLGATALVVIAMRMLAASVAGGDEGPVVHQSRLVRGH